MLFDAWCHFLDRHHMSLQSRISLGSLELAAPWHFHLLQSALNAINHALYAVHTVRVGKLVIAHQVPLFQMCWRFPRSQALSPPQPAQAVAMQAMPAMPPAQLEPAENTSGITGTAKTASTNGTNGTKAASTKAVSTSTFGKVAAHIKSLSMQDCYESNCIHETVIKNYQGKLVLVLGKYA